MKHVLIAAAGIVLFAVSMTPATATPGNGNGKGPGDDGGCSQTNPGSCTPDRGNECENGNHTGNPHCGGDDPTPTVVPTVTPTETPTADVPEEQPQDEPVVTPTATPTPVVVLATPVPVYDELVAVPQVPYVPIPPMPVDEVPFDVTTITALPHAGDGSAEIPTHSHTLLMAGMWLGGFLVGIGLSPFGRRR